MRRPGGRTAVAAALAFLLLGAGGLAVLPEARLALRAIAMKLDGSLAGMGWGELVTALTPGGPYHVRILVETGNPNLALRNPHGTDADAEAGREVFRERCAGCHGADGRGGTAPNLAGGVFRHGGSDRALFRTIERGVPGTAMTGARLPDRAVWQLVAHLRMLGGRDSGDPGGGAGGAAAARTAPAPGVTRERLRAADREPGNWLTYSGSYAGGRFSLLDQLRPDNVGRLDVLWVRQLPTEGDRVEATPLVVDGVMYVTEPPATALALDAATGAPLWSAARELPEAMPLCCGFVNRGLAVLGDRLYLGTLDARLVALDARTGAVVWDAEVADYRDGYSITGAPLAAEDLVIVGVAGGEYGIAGFLDAYDAASGERRWRFHTVPRPGEPASETWAGESWKTGGAGTWMTGSYDPELGLVYWGVGNPAPPFNGAARQGDNLYSNSVIALDVRSGRLAWHFQFTPHDEHDWDAAQVPVLADLEIAGAARRAMLWANRNGFFYLLDRETGGFLLARELVRQTWAKGIDSTGRPIVDPGRVPSPQGTLIHPGPYGGANWWSPSYSPLTGLLYVSVLEGGFVYVTAGGEPRRGRQHFGGGGQYPGKSALIAVIRAVEAATGAVAWEHRLSGPGTGRETEEGLGLSGLLSTAGGLLFGGAGEELLALDAATGELLWRFRTGGRLAAAPISYLADGRQVLAVAAGRSIFAFALDPASPPP